MTKLTIQHTIDTREGIREVTLTPMRAIRFKCLYCCCFDVTEVRLCELTECSLYPYRMGHGVQTMPESSLVPKPPVVEAISEEIVDEG